MKTLAIRLDDELHARLSMLSKLAGSSVTDTIRVATEKHLDTLAADPAITAKAEELRAEIERDAAAQRDALAALIDTSKSAPAPTPTDSNPVKKAATRGRTTT